MFENNDSIISLSASQAATLERLNEERKLLTEILSHPDNVADSHHIERLMWIDAERRVASRIKQMADYAITRLAEYAQTHDHEECLVFNGDLMGEIRLQIQDAVLSFGWQNSSSQIAVLGERMIAHCWKTIAQTSFYAGK